MHFFKILGVQGAHQRALRGSRGSKFKMKDVWHVGCLFSAILAKEPVFDLKTSFGTQPAPQDPSLGDPKGVQGVKIEVEGYMACRVSF